MPPQIHDTNLVVRANTNAGPLGAIIPVRQVGSALRYWTPKFIRETRGADSRYEELKIRPEPVLIEEGYLADVPMEDVSVELDERALEGLLVRLAMTTKVPLLYLDLIHFKPPPPQPSQAAPPPGATVGPTMAEAASLEGPTTPAASRMVECNACRRPTEVHAQVFRWADLREILMGARAFLCADCAARVIGGDGEGLIEELVAREVAPQEFKPHLVTSNPSAPSSPTDPAMLRLVRPEEPR